MAININSLNAAGFLGGLTATGASVGVLYNSFLKQAKESYQQHFPSNDFGDAEWGAYRHAYMSARFTQALGPEFAQLLGDLNEAANRKNTTPSRDLDYYNNDRGIEIGQSAPYTNPFKTDSNIAQTIANGINEIR
jgi:hypothetical protein